MQHTPGPWELIEAGDRISHFVPCNQKRESILTVVTEDDTRFAAVYHEADARLIAAAPELLKALKEYALVMGPAHDASCPGDDTCSCTWKPVNDMVNAAIAKAEGRP